ncbi:MAG: Calx-beta domain-containing protein, partial [Pseudohongiellaceae bacterium]
GGAFVTAVGTILDDDPGSLPTVTMPNLTVDEFAEVIRIPVRLSPATSREVEFDFRTDDGTARSGIEFNGRSGHVTTTPNANGWDVLIWLTSATREDMFDNPDKQFTLTLSNLRNAVFPNDAPTITSTITIRDDDTEQRTESTVSVADDSVDEGDDLQFTVTVFPPVPTETSVAFSVTPGTASSGTDYMAPTQTRLTFAPNQASYDVFVPTVADNNNENDETLTLTLSSPTGLVVSSTEGSATGTIRNRTEPILRIDAVTSSPITEGGNAVFTITASPPPQTNLVIPLMIQETGGDYLAGTPASAVTLAATQNTVTYTVATEDDSESEQNGSITVTFVTPVANAGYTLSRRLAATANIQDNDQSTAPALPVMTIAPPSAAVTEGQRVTFSVTATPAATTSLRVRVSIRQQGRYTNTTRTITRTLGAGRRSLAFSTSAGDDSAPDSNNVVTMTLVAGSGYTVGSPNSGSITLVENDVLPDPVISIRATASPVIEGNAAVFSISATPSATRDLVVTFSVNESGNFVAGTRPTRTTIRRGRSSVLVQVPTTDDNNDEANGSVGITLSNGTGYTVGSARSAAVRVNDNDESGGGNNPTQRRANQPVSTNVGSNLGNGYGSTIQGRTENGIPQGGGGQQQGGREQSYNLSLQGSSPLEFLVNEAKSRRDAHRRGQRATPLHIPRDMGFTVSLNGSNQTPTPASPDIGTAIENASNTSGNDLTLWGRVFYQESSGSEGELDNRVEFEGDVTGVMIGIDTYSPETGVLWGISLVEARGEMGYTSSGVKGTHETRLTGLHPYVGMQWGSGVRVWGTLGFDKGDIEINEEENPDDRYISDITMQTLGLGAYGPIVGRTTEAGNSLTLGFTGDGTFVRTEEDTEGAMSTSSGRLRMGLELEHIQTLESGNRFGSTLELTWRHDIGDGLAGGGAELGGTFNINLTSGLILSADARTLVYHSSDLDEWGVGLNLIWLPDRNRGLSLSFKPQWGSTSSRAHQLWNGNSNQFNQYGGNAFTTPGGASYALELKYGIPLSNNKNLLELFAKSNLNTNSSYTTTSLGATIDIGKTLSLGYEAALLPRNHNNSYGNGFNSYGSGFSGGYGSNYGSGFGSGYSNNSLTSQHNDPNEMFMPGSAGYMPHLQPGTIAYDFFMQPYGYRGGNGAQYQPLGVTRSITETNHSRISHHTYIRYLKRF